MKQCDCVSLVEEKIEEKLGVKCSADNLEILSGRTFSNFSYEETCGKRKREKKIPVLHSYCPFCGKPYKKEEGGE